MNERRTSPHSPKAEFAVTGLIVGACVGMIIGLVVEILGHRSLMVMQAGGIVGIVVGALVETVRFWWRKQRYRK